MIAPYKRPNFEFVASQLRPEQIATALETAFNLGLLVATERMEDAAMDRGVDYDDSCAIRTAMEVDIPELDEATRHLFESGEALVLQARQSGPLVIVKYANPQPGEEDLRFVIVEDRRDRVVIASLDFPDARVAPVEVVSRDRIVVVEQK